MSQINELEARITAALDRIAQGLEARQETGPETTSDEVAALKQQLEDEKLANAQLEERVKALRDKLAAAEAANEAWQSEQSQAMRKLDHDLQSLRKANQQLRDNNQALREANQSGGAEPHLINKSMLAELEGLRATRAADRDEVEAVLAELGQVINGSADPETQNSKTEEA